MVKFRRPVFLLVSFFTLTALLAAAMAYFYIPVAIATREYERVTLRELIPDTLRCCLFVGDSAQLDCSLVPETAVTFVSWSDCSDGVAAIDEDGCVTALSEGCTAVTVNGAGGVSAEVEVRTVRKPLPPDSKLPQLYYEKLPIANATSSLGEDYKPELVYLPRKYPANKVTQLSPEALEAYEALYNDCVEATGEGFFMISGYRSYEKQAELWDRAVAQGSTSDTQPPGHSEHQLGLTFDICNTWTLSNDFASSAAGAWVTENCWRYGLIIRYPEDKTAVTLIDYEAWHFRYVGVEHAKYIFEHGLCLEEYIELQELAEKEAEDYARTISAAWYISDRC